MVADYLSYEAIAIIMLKRVKIFTRPTVSSFNRFQDVKLNNSCKSSNQYFIIRLKDIKFSFYCPYFAWRVFEMSGKLRLSCGSHCGLSSISLLMSGLSNVLIPTHCHDRINKLRRYCHIAS